LLQVHETCNHNLKQRQADSLQQKQLTQQRDNIQGLEQENRKIQHHVEKLDDAARQLSKELELENGKRTDFQANSGILEANLAGLRDNVRRSGGSQAAAGLLDVIKELESQCQTRQDRISKQNTVRKRQIGDINTIIDKLESHGSNSLYQPSNRDIENDIYHTLKKLGTISEPFDTSSIKDLQSERERLADSERRLRTQLEQTSSRERSLAEQLHEAKGVKQQAETLNQSLDSASLKVQRLENEVDKCRREAEEADDQLRYLNERKHDVEQNLSDLRREHGELKIAKAETDMEYESIKVEAKNLRENLEEELEARNKVEDAYENLNRELKDAKVDAIDLEKRYRNEKTDLQKNLNGSVENRVKLEGKIKNLEASLGKVNKDNSETSANFDAERDELNWTIKLLQRQAGDNQKESTHYAELKRQSDQMLVKATDRQRELSQELNSALEFNRELENQVQELLAKSRDEDMNKNEFYLEREQYERVKDELEMQRRATEKLLSEKDKLARESEEFGRLKEEYLKARTENSGVSDELDDACRRGDKFERMYKEQKMKADQLESSLTRSQDQERKIYERLRKERKHQQKLWADMIEAETPMSLKSGKNGLTVEN